MSKPGQSWGRYPTSSHDIVSLVDSTSRLPRFKGPALPYGNGRSYGDSCQNPGGTLLHARGLDRFASFDPGNGTLLCEGGVTLAEILQVVVPQGWFLPVTPGTRHVTVGGAIANDVHGKNHHRAGTFGHHVTGFELLRSDGERLWCAPGGTSGLFEATVGGLGLTGVITSAELRMKRIPGPWMETESTRFDGLEDFFTLSRQSSANHEYTVAWIDCLAPRGSLGRGHFLCANHASCLSDHRPAEPSPRFSVPVTPPFSLINKLTLRPFNSIYYHRQRQRRVRKAMHYAPYFYPLDGIRGWNRIYGPRGFLQHQCVLPPENAQDAVAELLKEIRHSGLGSFLAVLKEFGDIPSLGLLSFPRAGTTLALDFPNTGQKVFDLLERLDAIVSNADGAVYPAKDARMSGLHFRKAFPEWERFQAHIDPQFSSGFWRRVMK